jgi:hypothetical protein
MQLDFGRCGCERVADWPHSADVPGRCDYLRVGRRQQLFGSGLDERVGVEMAGEIAF